MQYIVSRTSGDDDIAPVPGARKVSFRKGERNPNWDDKQWIVEISDLLEFVKVHGQCIVSIDNGGRPVLEIYDTYRE